MAVDWSQFTEVEPSSYLDDALSGINEASKVASTPTKPSSKVDWSQFTEIKPSSSKVDWSQYTEIEPPKDNTSQLTDALSGIDKAVSVAPKAKQKSKPLDLLSSSKVNSYTDINLHGMQYPERTLTDVLTGRMGTPQEVQDRINQQLSDYQHQDAPLEDVSDELIPGIGFVPKGGKELSYLGDAVKSGAISKQVIKQHEPILKAVQSGDVSPKVANNIIQSDPKIQQALKQKSFTDIIAENVAKEPEPITNLIDKHLVDMGEEPHFKTSEELSPIQEEVNPLDNPRLNELLDMRENVSAKDARSPQVIDKKEGVVYNNDIGNTTSFEYPSYSKNYNYDFKLTKNDVKDIRNGTANPTTLEKLKSDLDTLDNHPDYMKEEPVDVDGNPMFSKGEDITPEQRTANRDEWHKDSHPLTKNEDGTPKTFYHGSPVDIKEFKSDEDGFTYLTENPEYAGRYVEKNGKSNGIYPVHVKANKIFDTRNPKDKAIFEKEFYRKYGNGTPLDNRTGLPDWTDAGDMKEFFADKGYKYDGVMFAETLDQKGTGASLAMMKPESIKSVHNVGEYSPKSADILHSKGSKGSTTTESIHKSAKKLLGKNYDNLKGDINIVQSYKDLPKELVDNGVEFSSGGKVRGIFNSKDGKVHLVADTMKPEEVNGVLVHELLHKAEFSGEKILGESHDTIVLRLKQLKDEPLVKQAFKSAKDAGTDAKNINREMMSYLVEKYQLGIDMSPKLKQFVRNIIDAVKVFASKTAVKLGVDAKWLISKMNEKDIAALLKSSAIKQGEKVTAKGDSLFSKTMSRLQEWHKDSHPLTKNADGTPKVFYHGTSADFGEFKDSRINSVTKGYYFTDSGERASEYAVSRTNVRGGEANVKPVYLNVKNMLDTNSLKVIPKEEMKRVLGVDSSLPESRIIDYLKSLDMNSVKRTETLKKLGYDGVKNNRTYIAFNPEQIKSIHNRGTFDETNPNILFSKTPIKEQVEKVTDKAIETLQDYWKPVEKILQKHDIETGTDFGEAVNDARKAIYGRTGERIAEVRETQQKIVDNIHTYSKQLNEDEDILRKDLNSFLIAQHAPERNKALRDGAAGINTRTALQSLIDLRKNNPEKYKILSGLAKDIRKMNEQTLDILKDGQVITPELHSNLRAKYKNHVPLQRIMPEEKETAGSITGGKGFSVKSTGVKVAKGSDLEVSDILGNVSANVQEAIIRAEKNRVGLTMYDLFKSDKSLGEARGLMPKGIDDKGMPVKDFSGKPIMEDITNDMIVLFKDGKKKVIVPNDKIIAQVYNQLNVEERGIFANTIAPVTRTVAGLYTRFNPEFALSNVIRDLQEAFVYNVARMSGKDAVKAVSRQPWAMKSVTEHMLGKDTEGARLYKQMKLDGGTTGGVTLANKTKITKDIDDMFKLANSKPRQAIEKTFQYIDNYNTIFEDSTRLAAYKQALEKGLSRDKAAVIAKETTIDFNRKGTATPWLNAVYMFSNASIQGSMKMIKALKNPKVLAGTVGTISALSLAIDSHNDSVDPDWRDKVNEFERTSNYVILLDSKDGNLRRINIPIGWGFKPIKTIVETIRDVSIGKSQGNPFAKVLKSMFQAYTPISGRDVFSALTPSVLNAFKDIHDNINWKGQMISPKGLDLAKPSEKYFPTTPETLGGRLAIKLVEGTEKIGLDLTPEDIKYLVSSYGGGPVNFSTGVFKMIESASKGEDIKSEDTVMARRFYKETDPKKLESFTGKQDIKKLIEKVQKVDTVQERMDIIKEELPKLKEKDRSKAVYILKDGGIIPKRGAIIKQNEKAQWSDNILNDFQSSKTKQNNAK